jgi:hypothetical protein
MRSIDSVRRTLLACSLLITSAAFAADPTILLEERAAEANATMATGMKIVVLSPSVAESNTSALLSTPVLPTSTAGNCNITSAGGPSCDTVVQSNCSNNWTVTLACTIGTFPAACGTQNGANVTCSESSCQWKTFSVNGVCATTAPAGCGPTYAADCQAWTHARYSCQTSGPFCGSATLAPACGAQTAVVPCGDQNTFTRNCLNTTASGSQCSSAGASNTYGPSCISVDASVPGMCGNFSVAAGNKCKVIPIELDPDEQVGNQAYASAGLMCMAGLFLRRKMAA